MPKIINLKSDEDITSAVEYLWETAASEVYLTLPKGSVLLRNIIGLKLLKREADRLDKIVVLVTKDEVGRELAKRAGLAVRVTMPKVDNTYDELKQEEEEEEENTKGEVLKDMSPEKYESMIEEEVKLKREEAVMHSRPHAMSDIKVKVPWSDMKEIKKMVPPEGEREKIYFEKSEEINKVQEEIEDESDALDSYLIPGQESDEDYADEDYTMIEKESKRVIDLDEKRLAKTRDEKLTSIFFSYKFLSFFVGAALLILAAVLYFILPQADIVIVPKSESIVQDFSVSADKSITKVDLAQAKIPAQIIKLDKKESKDFKATGERQLNDKAAGIITIYNEYSSSPQALVATTRFVSENGKIFRLTKSLTVPGAKIVDGKIVASSIDASVVADQPGEEYNIGPANFKIPGFQGGPKYDSFYGRSTKAMSGGAIGLAKVVSQEDFDKAKAEIWQNLRPAIDQELKAQIPSGLKILEGALKEEMGTIESSAAVGAKADNFTITVKGSGTAIIFDEKDIYSLANDKIAESIDGKNLNQKEKQIEYSSVSVDFGKGQLNFKTKVTQKLVWNEDINSLKNLIVGKNEAQIRQIFEGRSEIEKARILFWPFWVKTVPTNLDKIKITISDN